MTTLVVTTLISLGLGGPITVEASSSVECEKRSGEHLLPKALQEVLQESGETSPLSARDIVKRSGRTPKGGIDSAKELSQETRQLGGGKTYVVRKCEYQFNRAHLEKLIAPYRNAVPNFRTRRFLVALRDPAPQASVDGLSYLADAIASVGGQIAHLEQGKLSGRELKALAQSKEANSIATASWSCKAPNNVLNTQMNSVNCTAILHVSNYKGNIKSVANRSASGMHIQKDRASELGVQNAMKTALSEVILELGKNASAPAEEHRDNNIFSSSWNPTALDFLNRAGQLEGRSPESLRLEDARRPKPPKWRKVRTWTSEGETTFGDKFFVNFSVAKVSGKRLGDSAVAQAFDDARNSLVKKGVAEEDVFFLDYFVDKKKTVWVLAGGRTRPSPAQSN